MSEVRKVLEKQAAGSSVFVKMIKWLGWLFIVIGAVLTITIFGAPAGIPLLLMGIFMVTFLTKFIARKYATLNSSTQEIAEIHEYKLQQARTAQSEGQSPKS